MLKKFVPAVMLLMFVALPAFADDGLVLDVKSCGDTCYAAVRCGDDYSIIEFDEKDAWPNKGDKLSGELRSRGRKNLKNESAGTEVHAYVYDCRLDYESMLEQYMRLCME